MSLVVTVYVPSGIVMAADSRITAQRNEERAEGERKVLVQQALVLSDNAYKVVALRSIGAGVSVYDAAMINNQPADSHVHRFEEEALAEGDDVIRAAEKLLAYFRDNFPGVPIGFHMAGYRQEERVRVPYVFGGHTRQEGPPKRLNVDAKGNVGFGIARSGDLLVVNRLIDQNLMPRFDAMPLQDAVDYAVHLIRTTIDTMRFEPRFPSVGGAIDVLVITPDGMQWVQRKELRGSG